MTPNQSLVVLADVCPVWWESVLPKGDSILQAPVLWLGAGETASRAAFHSASVSSKGFDVCVLGSTTIMENAPAN
jgi:hypothetical protein